MHVLAMLVLSLSLSQVVWADEDAELLVCMTGPSADIDGSKSYTTDASSLRLLLSLQRKDRSIVAVRLLFLISQSKVRIFGDAGRQAVPDKFVWRMQAGEVEHIYEELAAPRPAKLGNCL